ncbi:MAG: hypothetical protein N3G19_00795 [Candidatus Pacearchaeota archaeon]|nr:hypothetical protein [Candidatus Pacearchaeota archaeon]
MPSKKKEKDTSPEDEALAYYSQIQYLDTLDRNSSEARDMLAALEKEDPLKYSKLTPQAVDKKIKSHFKKAEELIKERVSYEWLIKNKPTDKAMTFLLNLPALKDYDKYKEIVDVLKDIKKAMAASEDKESYVRDYYTKKIEEVKTDGDKAIVYADLYAAVSNSEFLESTYKGILLSLQYELQKRIEEAKGKKEE